MAMVGVLPPWDDDVHDSAKRLLRQMTLHQQIEAQMAKNADALRRLDEMLGIGVGYGVVPCGWEPQGFERVPPPTPPPTIRLAPGQTRHISLDDD